MLQTHKFVMTKHLNNVYLHRLTESVIKHLNDQLLRNYIKNELT